MRIIGSGAVLALACLATVARAGDDRPGKETKATKEMKASKSYEVPYKFTAAQHIVVRLKINGKGPFNFILDTGAPALFVAVPVGKKAGVKADADGWATIDKIAVEGGLVMNKVRARIETPFQLEGMNGMGLAGLEIHGLIGYNVLAKYRMEFDFTRDKLVWTELNYTPVSPFQLRGKGGGGAGGLEAMGQIMKMIGGLLGRKANPDVALRGFFGMTLVEGNDHPRVAVVLDKGPAGAAGLKVGDLVTHVQGRGVDDVADVVRLTHRLRAGTSVKLTVQRGKATKEITFKITEGI
jgi:hypothetical protein